MGLTVIDLSLEVYDYESQQIKQILDAISLQVKPGELVAIIGEIGSGKTTFIQHLNGLKTPTDGKIFVQQKSFAYKNREWLQKVGIVLQFSQQQLFLSTVAEELRYAAKNFKRDISVEDLCQRVQLEQRLLKMHPRALSGGQMRKVAIASVLAAEPEILILDEPFAGLDWHARAEIEQLLKQLIAENMAIIVVSHDLHFVYQSCERAVVFSKGKIVADEQPKILFQQRELCEQLGIYLPDILATEYTRLDQQRVLSWLKGSDNK